MREVPICTFKFSTRDISISGRTISGGTSISGAEDLVRTDAGGYVSARFGEANLIGRNAQLAWKATKTWLEDGAVPATVRFCEAKHQPTKGRVLVPHSDGTPFSDDSLYAQWDCLVTAALAAEMGATSLKLNITNIGYPLAGGEWFSIDHPFMRDRAYNIHYVHEDGTVDFLPPLREDVPIGTELEFADPKCTMRLMGDMRNSYAIGSNHQTGDAEFVEHFPGDDGYE